MSRALGDRLSRVRNTYRQQQEWHSSIQESSAAHQYGLLHSPAVIHLTPVPVPHTLQSNPYRMRPALNCDRFFSASARLPLCCVRRAPHLAFSSTTSGR